MRKILFLSTLLGFISYRNFAQDSDFTLGIKIAPAIHSTRVLLDDPNILISNAGSNMKLSFGLVVDKQLTDNYILSTGLIYLPKQVSIGIVPDDPTGFNSAETYKLQYLQIPATIKLFTNEIIPDAKVYFQLGMALEIKVYEEADPTLVENDLITKFQPVNLPVILGAGLEYNLGINTVAFGGISYHRGLNNIVKESGSVPELEIRSTVLSIDIGVKF